MVILIIFRRKNIDESRERDIQQEHGDRIRLAKQRDDNNQKGRRERKREELYQKIRERPFKEGSPSREETNHQFKGI